MPHLWQNFQGSRPFLWHNARSSLPTLGDHASETKLGLQSREKLVRGSRTTRRLTLFLVTHHVTLHYDQVTLLSHQVTLRSGQATLHSCPIGCCTNQGLMRQIHPNGFWSHSECRITSFRVACNNVSPRAVRDQPYYSIVGWIQSPLLWLKMNPGSSTGTQTLISLQCSGSQIEIHAQPRPVLRKKIHDDAGGLFWLSWNDLLVLWICPGCPQHWEDPLPRNFRQIQGKAAQETSLVVAEPRPVGPSIWSDYIHSKIHHKISNSMAFKLCHNLVTHQIWTPMNFGCSIGQRETQKESDFTTPKIFREPSQKS